jgi:serine/threonine-protein kinase
MTEVLRSLEPLEQRFGTGRQIGQQIGAALTKLPVIEKPKVRSDLSVEEICRLTSWPKDKPIAEIVFPHILQTSHGPIATLWVMLSKDDIMRRLTCTRYNQFLLTMAPHPMMLWITALHRRDADARWLPCYLDLKNRQGQEVTRLLGKLGKYRILFFAKEEPHRCADVKVSNIAPHQQTRLLQWANDAHVRVSANQPNFSKQMLRQELEKLKPKIIKQLEAIHAEGISDISG